MATVATGIISIIDQSDQKAIAYYKRSGTTPSTVSSENDLSSWSTSIPAVSENNPCWQITVYRDSVNTFLSATTPGLIQGPDGTNLTSTTSLTIGTGSKTFTVGRDASLSSFSVGTRLRAWNTSVTTSFMEGLVTSFSGTSLVINIDVISGSGTIATWTIGLSGERGATGAAAQYVVVNGEQVFRYSTPDIAVPFPTNITLSASLFGGLTEYNWQYWNGSQWTSLSGTINTNTYNITYNNTAWSTNKQLRIRCTSNPNTYYDEITIIKIEGMDIEIPSNALATWVTDGLPQYPNDPTSTKYFQNIWATTESWVGNNVTLSVVSSPNTALRGVSTSTTYDLRKDITIAAGTYTFRVKIRKTVGVSNNTSTRLFIIHNNGATLLATNYAQFTVLNEWIIYEARFTGLVSITSIGINIVGVSSGDAIEATWIYVGTGTYNSKLIDSSGKKNHGTPHGILIRDTNSDQIEFDGVNDYITTDVTYNNATEWSFSCWAYKRSYIQYASLYSDYTSTHKNIICGYDTSNDMVFYCGSGGSTGSTNTSGGLFPINEWAHWIFVYKGGEYQRIYKNNILVAEKTSSVIASIAATHNSGRSLGKYIATSVYFDGIIRNACMFSKALTEKERNYLFLDLPLPKYYTYPDWVNEQAASDNIITPPEKQYFKEIWLSIWQEENRSTSLPTSIGSITTNGEYKISADRSNSRGFWTPTSSGTLAKTYYDAVESLRSAFYGSNGLLINTSFNEPIDISTLSPTLDTRISNYRAARIALDFIDTSPPTRNTINAPSNNTSTGYVTITWLAFIDGGTQPSGTQGYRIWRGTSATGTNKVCIGSTTDLTFTDTAVVQGTTYYYDITAYDKNGNECDNAASGWGSVLSSCTTAPETPSTPTAIARNGRIDINWTKNSEKNIDYYIVEKYVSGTPLTPWNVYDNSYTETGVSATKAVIATWTYTIQAVNTLGNISPASTASSAPTTTVYTPADDLAPNPLAAAPTLSRNYDGSIIITWVATGSPSTSPDVGYYRVYRRISTDEYDASKMVIEVPSSILTFTDSGLANGISYKYEVSVVDYSGMESIKSSLSTALSAVDTTAPDAPEPTCSPLFGAIHVSWTGVNEEGCVYEIWRCETSWADGSAGLRATVAGSKNATSAYDDAISPSSSSITYYYKLKVLDRWGNKSGFNATAKSAVSVINYTGNVDGTAASSVSNTVTNTSNFQNTNVPTNTPSLITPTISAQNDGSVNVTLTWTYTQGAVKAEYFLLHYVSGSTAATTAAPTYFIPINSTSYTIRGLPAGIYSFGLRAGRACMNGEVYSSLSVTNWTNITLTGGFFKPNNNPSSVTSGLQMNSSNMGYYDGTRWRSYTDSSGNFYLANSSGTNSLSFQASNGNFQIGSGGKELIWNAETGILSVPAASITGTLTAGQIATGAITADKIVANAITADKIDVRALSLVNNISATRDTARGWHYYHEGGSSTYTPSVVDTSGGYAVRIVGATSGRMMNSSPFLINPSLVYNVECELASNVVSLSDVYASFQFFASKPTEPITNYFGLAGALAYNAGNMYKWNSTTNKWGTTTDSFVSYRIHSGITVSNAYSRIKSFLIGSNVPIEEVPAPATNGYVTYAIKLPTNANYAVLSIFCWKKVADNDLLVKNIKVYEGNSGKIIADNIVANAITADKIDATDLGTKTIQLKSDGKIYSGTGTYNNTNTPLYLGADGKFSLSNKLTWNGTTLSINGSVISTSGTIGGFTLADSTLTGGNLVLTSTGNISAGTSNDIIRVSASDATYRLWVGNATAASAPFSVTKAGGVKATSGTIGGFTLAASTLTGGNLVLTNTGNISAGTSNDIIRVSANDATYRLWIGNATAASAPFRVTKNGSVTANNLTATGTFTGVVNASNLVIGPVTAGNTMNIRNKNYKFTTNDIKEFKEFLYIMASDGSVNFSMTYYRIFAIGGQLGASKNGIPFFTGRTVYTHSITNSITLNNLYVGDEIRVYFEVYPYLQEDPGSEYEYDDELYLNVRISINQNIPLLKAL